MRDNFDNPRGRVTVDTKTEPKVKFRSPPEIYSAEQITDYLLNLTRMRQVMLPYGEFPLQMVLPEQWRETMRQMQQNYTNEEFAPIVGDLMTRRVVVQPKAAVGLQHSVTFEQVFREISKVLYETGTSKFIGLIHSHPDNPAEVDSEEFQAGFSVADIYNFLMCNNPNTDLMGVTERNKHIFLFKSRETQKQIEYFHMFPTLESFEKFWYEKYGFKITSPATEDHPTFVEKARPDANIWELNEAIARYYMLALYKGKSTGNLSRYI